MNFSKSIIKRKDDFYSYIPSSLFYRKGGHGLDNLAIKMKGNIEYLSILKNYLDTIKNEFDYIIIDCPPSSNLITQSAFLLSDFYLIPTVLDEISTNGVIHYIHTVQNTYSRYCDDEVDGILAKHYFGDAPKLIGIFYNLIRGQVDYTVAKKNFNEALKEKGLEAYVFSSKINNYIDIARSTEKGMSSERRFDFENFSSEVLKKISEMQEK